MGRIGDMVRQADRMEERRKDLGLDPTPTREVDRWIMLGVTESSPFTYEQVDGETVPVPTEYLQVWVPSNSTDRVFPVQLDREQAAELIERLTKFVEG